MLMLEVDRLKKALYKKKKIIFAFLFGSSKSLIIREDSDIDIAVYLRDGNYDNQDLLDILSLVEESTGCDRIDLVIINDVKSVALNYEIIMGRLIFTRDKDLLAGYFSLSLRKYEDELQRWERARRYRIEARFAAP